jgi:hypothetical protein
MSEEERKIPPGTNYSQMFSNLDSYAREKSLSAAKVRRKIVKYLPEANYYNFSFWTILINEMQQTSFSTDQPFVGPLWNYVDAACSLLLAIDQLQDKRKHRRKATKIKGVTNLLSSAQVIALTTLNFSTFGAGAFAASGAVSFLHSVEETVHQWRRYMDKGYWLADSNDRLDDLNTEISKLEYEIKSPESYQTSTLGKWALYSKKERLVELKTQRDQLQNEIDFVKADPNNFKFVKERVLGELQAALFDSITYGIAFLGMALLCVPDPELAVDTASLILIGMASVLYFLKHSYKVSALKEPNYEYYPLEEEVEGVSGHVESGANTITSTETRSAFVSTDDDSRYGPLDPSGFVNVPL